MKFFRSVSVILVLLAFSTELSQARTDTEVKNYLKQAAIPELHLKNTSVTQALAAIDQIGALKQHKIAFVVSVAQKADMTFISIDLTNASAYDAIQAVCKLSGLDYTFKRDQVLIF